MPKLPPPPVPQTLREMLKDYPEHILRLQEVLRTVVEKPSKATPPFEVAIWMLESRLGTFISEAREELKAAEAGGDPEVIERTKTKLSLMRSTRLRFDNDLSDLWDYFRVNKGAFE